MTKLTKERLEEIAELARKATYKPCAMHMTNLLVVCDSEVIEEMARQLLASMEQEPVSYTCSDALDDVYCGSAAMMGPAGAVGEVPLYAAPQLPQPAVLSVSEGVLKSLLPDVEKSEFWFEHNGKIFFEGVRFNNAVFEACHAAMLQGSQPVSKREQVRREHAEWSDKTFGDVGPVGPLKHLSKEALEAAAEPDDLSEWADMQFLLWDAQRRAGISDGEITAAMEEKLKVNMARQWPEPKDGEPRQHLKPAPQTVPDSVISAAVNGIMATYADNAEDCREMVRTHVEQACRAAIQESGHG